MLEACNNRHELNVREYYYIQKYNAVSDENFYNLKEGGHGGSVAGYVHHTDAHKQFMSLRMSGNRNPNYGSNTNHWTAQSHFKVSSANSVSGNPNFGKTCKPETKARISAKAKNRVWINDGEITKHVKSSEVIRYIENGWKYGRLLYSSTTIEHD